MPTSNTTHPNLYTFRAEVLDYPKDSWRDIQILSTQTFGELAVAVLAAFEAQGSHMWNLETSDAYFEYNLDSQTANLYRKNGAIAVEPDDKTIGELNFKKGEQLKLDYDYGTTWTFILTVTKVEPAAGSKASSYPRVSGGHGPRMLDDVDPFVLRDLMKFQKKGETIADHPELEDLLGEEDIGWRYDDFDLGKLRRSFRDNYKKMLKGYREMPASGPDPFAQMMLDALTRMAMEGFGAPKEKRKKRTPARPTAKPSKPRIYTFRFESAWYPDDFWREVEITSEATVGDLAGAVLASFDTDPDHLWSVYHNGFKYYHFDDDDQPGYERKPANPIRAYDITLGELGLRVRSKMEMMYDYGTTWYFNMRVVGSRPQTPKDKPGDYPRLIAGHGRDLLDDMPMDVIYEIQEGLDSGEDLEKNEYIMGYIGDWYDEWEYPEFNLEEAQKRFPGRARSISAMYSHGRPF